MSPPGYQKLPTDDDGVDSPSSATDKETAVTGTSTPESLASSSRDGAENNALSNLVLATTVRRRDKLSKAPERSKPVAWKDLPQKRQLMVITAARLSEPLVQTSLQVRIATRQPIERSAIAS
jgi:outer membrane cobalamin receptor